MPEQEGCFKVQVSLTYANMAQNELAITKQSPCVTYQKPEAVIIVVPDETDESDKTDETEPEPVLVCEASIQTELKLSKEQSIHEITLV